MELKRKLAYSDLQVTPDDGKRYELIRGDLHVTPSPSLMHQRVSRELLLQLVQYFHMREIGEVFYAPIDLILTGHDVFVPDLAVVADSSGISQRGIEKAPLLVVEILSPSTRRMDLTVKAKRYAELGVEHYWIIDPDRRSLVCHRLDEGTYKPVVEGQGEATVTHPAWDGLAIALAPLWR